MKFAEEGERFAKRAFDRFSPLFGSATALLNVAPLTCRNEIARIVGSASISRDFVFANAACSFFAAVPAGNADHDLFGKYRSGVRAVSCVDAVALITIVDYDTSMSKGVKPSKYIQQAVAKLLAEHPTSAVVKRLGVAREPLARVAAGLPVWSGTIAVLEKKLGEKEPKR